MIRRLTKALARMSFDRALGIIVIALSIVSVSFVAVQTMRLSDVTECQSAYNDAYTTAIQARSEAARDERQAQRVLWTTVLNQQIPVDQKVAAFHVWLKSLDTADRARDKAAIPTRRC